MMNATASILSLVLLLLNGPPAALEIQWLDPTTYDFGDIPKGQPVETAFRFQNRGDQPLIIDNVRPSCGCTTPEWPRGVILPDSSAAIRVAYSAGTPGPFKKLIKVYFDGQRRAERLYLEGVVIAP